MSAISIHPTYPSHGNELAPLVDENDSKIIICLANQLLEKFENFQDIATSAIERNKNRLYEIDPGLVGKSRWGNFSIPNVFVYIAHVFSGWYHKNEVQVLETANQSLNTGLEFSESSRQIDDWAEDVTLALKASNTSAKDVSCAEEIISLNDSLKKKLSISEEGEQPLDAFKQFERSAAYHQKNSDTALNQAKNAFAVFRYALGNFTLTPEKDLHERLKDTNKKISSNREHIRDIIDTIQFTKDFLVPEYSDMASLYQSLPDNHEEAKPILSKKIESIEEKIQALESSDDPDRKSKIYTLNKEILTNLKKVRDLKSNGNFMTELNANKEAWQNTARQAKATAQMQLASFPEFTNLEKGLREKSDLLKAYEKMGIVSADAILRCQKAEIA